MGLEELTKIKNISSGVGLQGIEIKEILYSLSRVDGFTIL
jgi:hypothetical protein